MLFTIPIFMYKNTFRNYLTYEKRYSSHTISSYCLDLEQFLDFCLTNEDDDLLNVIGNHLLIRKWLVSLMEQNLRSSSINRKISTLKTFFKLLKREGYMDHNPMLKIVSPKKEKRTPSFVHQKEMEKAVFPFKGNEFEDSRDLLIIELLYATGIRRQELIHIKDQDIDLIKKTIKIIGKRKKERLVPLQAHLERLVHDYLMLRDEHIQLETDTCFFVTLKGQALYPNFVYRVVKKYLTANTTNKNKNPHVLRHSFATHLLNNGAELNAIKELLGHASLAATQVYTHNTFEKINSIYKQAHPRA